MPDNVQVCVNAEKGRTCPCVPNSPKEKRYDQLMVRLEVLGMRYNGVEEVEPNHWGLRELRLLQRRGDISLNLSVRISREREHLAKQTPSMIHEVKNMFSTFTSANRLN